MTSQEIVAYLADLTFLFDHHEKLGTTKNASLTREFEYWHGVLVKQVEQEHEARNRPHYPERSEARADLTSREPRRS